MTPERWEQIKDLFEAALERDEAHRATLLDNACVGDLSLRAEVELLVAAHEQAGSFMVAPAFAPAPEALADDTATSLLGRRIGPYQILKEIGCGGMGAVYLAVRADDEYQKQVAIKLVQRGMGRDTIRRFRKERQILANLDHPNIAKLLDGGTTDDGLSYLVMDYVEGLPIDVYCDTHKLSTAARLNLFCTICSAVEYAHQHHVVHRDLKPSNILVTADGVPKLLDFGIAKLLSPELSPEMAESTTTSLRPMTPGYASPEQVRGEEITPASDIYSLGVLLYELLTGHRPYRFQRQSPQEIEWVLCEAEPEKPSAVIGRTEEVTGRDGPLTLTPESVSETREGHPEKLRRRLAGDIDNIVLMALRKEPERRYTSVEQFSEDVRRHLDGLPVIARKDTLTYRSAKFLRRNKAGAGAVAVIALLLVALLTAGLYLLPQPTPGIDKPIHSLVVLPLQNLSGDPTQEYLADGMTDALINDLAQISALRVLSRTSAMQYKGARQPLPEVAKALNVDAVIEGSVQRSGDRVRIAVQLIHAATDRPLWAHSYERDLGDGLALQSEVAQAIAREIRIKLTPQERSRLATVRQVNREAYEEYLLGRYFWNKNTVEGIQKGIEHFEQAIAKDPSYALAYAGLADSYVLLGAHGFLPPHESFPRARWGATKALEIDDQLGEAHNTLGAVKLLYEWDLAVAEREFQRAIEINPSYALARFWYSNLLMAIGRPEASIAERKRALELDPLSLPINNGLAEGFRRAGQYDAAIAQARKVTEMDPNYWMGHRTLGLAYAQKGMHEEAIAELHKAINYSRNPQAIANLGYVYAVAGKREEAAKVIAELEEMSKRQYVPPHLRAAIYAAFGEKEQAFEWLNKAYEVRDSALIFLKPNPHYSSLRTDPRFIDLVRRVGLPP